MFLHDFFSVFVVTFFVPAVSEQKDGFISLQYLLGKSTGWSKSKIHYSDPDMTVPFPILTGTFSLNICCKAIRDYL